MIVLDITLVTFNGIPNVFFVFKYFIQKESSLLDGVMQR